MSRKNPTGEMTLVEHLQELRTRVIISAIAVTVGATLGWFWYVSAPFGWPVLGDLLRGPYCSLPAEYRVSFGNGEECRLLATSPFEMLLLRMKIAGLAGTVIASPVWLYQVWAFVTPGLYKNERRATLTFVSIAVALFVGGAVLAYEILNVGLEFLLSVGGNFQTAALTGERYFSFLLALMVIFGLSFELPLLIVSLNLIGLVEYNDFKGKRSYMIVAVFIFAAIITPGQDPFTMTVLSLAVCILVEASLQFCRIHDKRAGVAAGQDLDDEEASRLDYTPEPVSPVQSTAASRDLSAAADSVDAPAPVVDKRDNGNTTDFGHFDDVL